MKTSWRDWAACVIWLGAGSIALAFANDYHALVLGTVACTAIVGVGLNVLLGLAGQTSLGHAAFYAIGAYACTLLTMRAGLPWLVALPAAALITGIAGALLSLPALRVRGPYLAMVTIAFGYFVEQAIAEWKSLTGGWNGIMNIPQPAFFGDQPLPWHLALVALVVSGLLIPAFTMFARSDRGIVMRATRDAEVAASTLGANLMMVRALAFGISAALTGLAGGLFATLNGFISPESFPFSQSINFLLMVMIGGVGQASGPLVGALVVVLLPEALSTLAEYRLLFMGGLLLLVLLIAPRGIVGSFSAWLGSRLRAQRACAPAVADTAMAKAWIARDAAQSLSVFGLGISFGGNRALSDVTISAAGGEITSLIGPNGAGKTTLLNVVTGFYSANQGTFRLGERDLTRLRDFQIGRASVARTFQTSQLFDAMTVLDNVAFGLLQGRLAHSEPGRDPIGTCLSLLAFVGFRGDPQSLAGALAHVDRRLVELARALATRPAMLLLDEPAAGLSAEEKQHLGNTLASIARERIGVMLIEHDMSLVMGISDRIHVLDSGRLIASGTPPEVQADPAVRAAYLGEAQGKFLAALHELQAASHATGADVLVVGRVHAHYGASDVLTDINLAVAEGQTVCVLGANGAGKSTLMRVICGLHQRYRGAVGFNGRDISHKPAHEIAAMGLIMVPEGRQVFTELTVEDNILIGGYARGGVAAPRLSELYAMFPKLYALRQRRAGLLSGGEQQMLAIARGLAARPVVMLLDEPSLGLAPVVVEDLFTRMAALRAAGMTLVLVDQMADMALALSDKAHLLSAGQLRFSGAPDALRDSGELEQAYLH